MLKKKISNLGKDQVLFVNECLRFLFYSYVFYNTEPVIQNFFNKIKQMLNTKETKQELKFDEFLNGLVFFLGSQILRQNSLLLIYISVY